MKSKVFFNLQNNEDHEKKVILGDTTYTLITLLSSLWSQCLVNTLKEQSSLDQWIIPYH